MVVCFRRRGSVSRLAFIFGILAISVLPFIAAMALRYGGAPGAQTLAGYSKLASPLGPAVTWIIANEEPVQENRVLASFPEHWTGTWLDVDRNYGRFEKWFSDNLGFRSLMIRVKNEIDFALFHSSSRVYFGKDQEIYGRSIIDTELRETERVLGDDTKIHSTIQGMSRLAQALEREGITAIFITPVMKEYFIPDRLPFFAPRLPAQSNFMRFYDRLNASPDIHFIDVNKALRQIEPDFPLYYRQDFHWTDMSALQAAKVTTEEVARLNGSKIDWNHAITTQRQPYFGSDARFAALLEREPITELALKKTWVDRHVLTQFDPQKTRLEFETDTLADPALLPPVCLYGNSFSDGMLRAGMPDFFQKMTKIRRDLPLDQLPDLMKGRCRFAVVQILDISAWSWKSFQK